MSIRYLRSFCFLNHINELEYDIDIDSKKKKFSELPSGISILKRKNVCEELLLVKTRFQHLIIHTF